MTRSRAAALLAVTACLTPVVLLLAAGGVRAGALSLEVGFDLLAQRVGPVLAGVGALAAIAVVVLAIRRRASWKVAGVAAVVAASTVGGYAWHMRMNADAPGEDVSTDLADPPTFGVLAAARGAGGPAGPVEAAACPAARAVPTQLLPENAVWALQRSGFAVVRAGVTGVYATRRSFFFGFTHDAVIRIRPGRSDIRVAARDRRSHGGEACRLATDLSEALASAT